MKHLLLLLLPLLSICFTCIAEDGAKPVYDTDNQEVTSGESYYVLPADHGTGGGGGLRKFPTSRRCNFLVSQAHNETNLGTPVRFHPPNDDSLGGKILLSTNVTVSFHILTTCVQTMYWHVVGFSQFSPSSQPHDRVAVGKNEGASYPMPLPSEFVFRVEKYDGATKKGYKLVSCAGKGPCKDLGLYASKGTTWLAISDLPFAVVFKKYIYA
ncbi:unnamed protein product [Urochloa decumbens]|uniref:Uncharacterized protein n=1 Tax=Urochloa decumbens TaxID=240449 RepID=A0ABC9GDR4_9POAL